MKLDVKNFEVVETSHNLARFVNGQVSVSLDVEVKGNQATYAVYKSGKRVCSDSSSKIAAEVYNSFLPA